MSVEAINWSLKQAAPTPIAKFVLVLLANLADADGRCWPGIDYISSRTQYSRRTVIRAIAELGDAGLLASITRPGDGEGRKSNLYELAMCQFDTLGQSANRAGQSATVTPNTKDTLKNLSTNRKTQFPHAALPADWEDYCKKTRPDLDPQATFDMCRDYWLGRGDTMKDWSATWRNWVRRERQQVTPEPKTNAHRPKLDPAGARPGESWEAYEQRMMRDRARV